MIFLFALLFIVCRNWELLRIFSASASVFIPFSIPILIYQIKETICIDDRITFFRNKQQISVQFNNIKKISYKSIFGLHFTETIIIHTNDNNYKNLFIDSTFQNYFEIWELLIRKTKEQNIDVKIDEQIEKCMNKRSSL